MQHFGQEVVSHKPAKKMQCSKPGNMHVCKSSSAEKGIERVKDKEGITLFVFADVCGPVSAAGVDDIIIRIAPGHRLKEQLLLSFPFQRIQLLHGKCLH
jgi:hypothetical protein